MTDERTNQDCGFSGKVESQGGREKVSRTVSEFFDSLNVSVKEPSQSSANVAKVGLRLLSKNRSTLLKEDGDVGYKKKEERRKKPKSELEGVE